MTHWRHTCVRCKKRPGLQVKLMADVSDVFPWQSVQVEQILCTWCKADANRESLRAHARRSGSRGLHFHNEFLVVP